jgi:hypothetical protein
MLPLLTGIAVGAGAVVAINNRKELKEKISSGASSVKETAVKAKDTVVEKAKVVKKTVGEKADCLTSKKDTNTKEVEQKDEK